jgi:hypothetical protein
VTTKWSEVYKQKHGAYPPKSRYWNKRLHLGPLFISLVYNPALRRLRFCGQGQVERLFADQHLFYWKVDRSIFFTARLRSLYFNVDWN